MHDARRYAQSLDEHALFARGATSWRLDIHTHMRLEAIVRDAAWHAPENYTPPADQIVAPKPIATLSSEQEAAAAAALQDMLNDPSLVPNLRMLGLLSVGGIELQNGALDPGWHHDGLAGKRHGHAGDFFCIIYFSEKTWDDAWGGHFEYGTRSLGADWPLSGFAPEGPVHRIAPAARTALLGWNQNPLLVHRSAPLTVLKDRVTMIASINLIAR